MGWGEASQGHWPPHRRDPPGLGRLLNAANLSGDQSTRTNHNQRLRLLPAQRNAEQASRARRILLRAVCDIANPIAMTVTAVCALQPVPIQGPDASQPPIPLHRALGAPSGLGPAGLADPASPEPIH